MLVRSRSIDVLLGLITTLLGLVALIQATAGYDLPFEDAAMLLRYSEHLANGDGITWNVGEAPVDGATDFLYMVSVGALTALGIPLVSAGFWLSATCHLLVVPIIYATARRNGASRATSIIASGYVALGPGVPLVAAYFGTSMFALGAACSWALALEVGSTPSRKIAIAFSLACLITSLVRPEGVILSLLLLGAIGYSQPRSAKTMCTWFCVVFGSLGLGYFIWRWNYFGYPLPNPFYKKGGGRIYPASLLHSIENVWKSSGLFVIVLLLGLLSPRLRRQALTALLPVAGFASVWLILSDEMNFRGRFQYAVVPICAISFAPLADALLVETGLLPSRLAPAQGGLRRVGLFGLMLVAGLLTRRRFPSEFSNYFGLREAGRALSPFQDKGYTLATTEAGLLPLYSGWTAVDTWGLNDAYIAHAHELPVEYLERRHPHVVMIHSFSSPSVPEIQQEQLRGWSQMVQTLQAYVTTHDYDLVAAYGRSPFETHFYYVRRNFADAAEITKKLQTLSYDWFGPCVNWVDAKPLRVAK